MSGKIKIDLVCVDPDGTQGHDSIKINPAKIRRYYHTPADMSLQRAIRHLGIIEMEGGKRIYGVWHSLKDIFGTIEKKLGKNHPFKIKDDEIVHSMR